MHSVGEADAGETLPETEEDVPVAGNDNEGDRLVSETLLKIKLDSLELYVINAE